MHTPQKASVGRIVHVLVPTGTPNNGSDVAPAIITRAWSDTAVNVRALTDSDQTPWLCSVSLVADEEAARTKREADRAARRAVAPDAPVFDAAIAFWPSRA